MNKIQIISDNNSRSLKIKKSLLKVLKKEQIKEEFSYRNWRNGLCSNT